MKEGAPKLTEEEELLAIGQLRTNPGATPEQIKEAEERSKELQEKMMKGVELPPVEDTGNWEFEKPSAYDLARVGKTERAKEIHEATKKAEAEEAENVVQEIAAMPEEERKSFGENLRWLGFRFEEKKNRVLSGLLGKTLDGLDLDEKGQVGRFVTAARDKFAKNAEAVLEKEKALENKENQKALYNAGYLFGNTLKYGRILYDFTKWSVGSPLRGIMLAGTAVKNLAEIGEEARFLDDESKSKTRVADIDEAYAQADNLYKEAKAKSPDGTVSAEMLKDTYRRKLPQDLQERLKQPEFANGFVQKIIGEDMKWAIDRLNASIAEAKSEDEVNILLRKWDRDLQSYDRIIGNYGTVDGWAMTFKYLQSVGKGMIWGSTIATLEVSADKLWGDISEVFASADERTVTAEIDSLPGGDIEASNAAETEVPVKEVVVEATDAKGVETIYKGGSVSKAIHAMVDKGEISKEDFLKAWKNPESLVDVKGEKVHISKVGLVYEGNQVRFIAGENGGSPRFEVLQGNGPEFGSDKDLHARYEELKKIAPDWLEESVHGDAGHHTGEALGDVVTPEANPEFEVSPPIMDAVLEGLKSDWSSLTLIEKQAHAEELRAWEIILSGAVENTDTDEDVRLVAEEALELVKELQAEVTQSEQALRDKLYGLGFKQSGQQDMLLNGKPDLSVRIFLEKHLEKPEYAKEKLFSWIKTLKPGQAELNMNLGTFIKSRFK